MRTTLFDLLVVDSHILYLGKCTSIAIHFPALESSSETHSGCADYLQDILGSTENYRELLGSDMKYIINYPVCH